MSEVVLKLIDVAKHVADRYSSVGPARDSLPARKDATKEWTTLFAQAYEALKDTLEVVEG